MCVYISLSLYIYIHVYTYYTHIRILIVYIYIYIIDGNMYNLPLYTVAQGRSGSYPVSG